jgi:transcriptional regulator with XRE-family HTH domain
MNKFSLWIKNNDKKHRSVAEKLGISTSTLHDILRKGQIPNIKIAYKIEKYTCGAITLYDWVDEREEKNKILTNVNIEKKEKKINA